MRELNVTVPLLAAHRIHEERRIALSIGTALESWRPKLYRRGINLLSVSQEGLISNVFGIADRICQHIYRTSLDDLRDMVEAGMPLVAIEAFTGIRQDELSRVIPKFYGKSIRELREEAQERVGA